MNLIVEHNDSPIILDGKTRIYGRQKLLKQILRILDEDQRLIIRGPSGIGKSVLAIALRNSLRISNADEICLLHECESQAHTLNYFLGELTRKLLEEKDLPESSLIKYKQAFAELASSSAWQLLKSIGEDISKKVIPGGSSTMKTLIQMCENTDSIAAAAPRAEKLQKAAHDDPLGSFLTIIDTFAKNKINGTLIIDRLEGASSEVVRAINSLAHCLPRTWRIILLVNDEITPGINNYNLLWPEMCYDGAKEISVPGITIESLELWYLEKHGVSPSRTLLRQAIKACSERPLYLNAWLSGADPSDTEEIISQRIGEYYKNRLSDLDKSARHILYKLSLLPEGVTFPISLCRQIETTKTGLEITDILAILEKAGFLKSIDGRRNSFSFVHDITHKMVRDQLSINAKIECANEMVKILYNSPDPENSIIQYYTVPLLVYSHQENEIRQRAPILIDSLVRQDSCEAALEIYNLTKPFFLIKEQSSVYILGAEIMWHLGEYRDALSELELICHEQCLPDVEAEHNILRGKIYLRLNEYKNSLRYLDKALDFYKNNNDSIGIINTYNEINTIFRDLGKYDMAEKQALNMLELANKIQATPYIIAKTMESAVRSLAFTNKCDEGVKLGFKALEIAQKYQFKKIEGNAHLSIAECYRHHQMLNEAEEHYIMACEIARKIANRDSFIWSSLGLSDTYYLDDELTKAEEILEPIGFIVSKAREKYPLEYRHWKLSVEVIKFTRNLSNTRQLNDAFQDYKSLGIKWPFDYYNTIVINKLREPKRL